MRLTRLDIVGFKSFAKKTELIFSDGITAVIGPNGSGKSNIADAVRWVLGEQSARALRGTRMEDVIFGGTQTKKALSYCEVTLTFDNTDHLLPIDYEEAAITRRVYRSGESEYCINRRACRLKDIQDLFHDTGIGKDGYSIIGQGKVDEILSGKSADRRTALEEAAGVMRFRIRKEEAERKLDHTEKNLERIEDILFELRDRLLPLEEQSRTAREYLHLRDELKDNEINLFLYQTDRLQERIAVCRQTVEQLKAEEETERLGEETVVSEIAEAEMRSGMLEGLISQHQSMLLGMLSGVENTAGDCKLLLERKARAAEDGENARKRMELARRHAEELKKQIETETASDETAGILAALDAELVSESESLKAADEAIRELENDIESRKNAVIEALNRLSDAKSLLAHFDTMHGALADRIAEIEKEISHLKDNREGLDAELREAEEELAALTDEEEKCRNEGLSLINGSNETTLRFNQAQESFTQSTEALLRLQSRRNALEELARSREGFYESVKLLMRDSEKDPALKGALIGVVAELIRVPAEYEQAITMSLGSSLQNIVTETADDAKLVIEYLRKHDYGRATILPLELLRANSVTGPERDRAKGEGVIGFASDLIEYDPKIENAIRFLLGRTVVVKDLDAGIRLKKKTGGSFHIASLNGDIISTGGSMSGGSSKKRNFSILGREREIQSLADEIRKKEESRNSFRLSMDSLKEKLENIGKQTAEQQAKLQECRIHTTRQQEKVEIIRRDVSENDLRIDKLEAERQTVSENLEDLVRQRDDAERDQSGIEQDNTESRRMIAEGQKKLYVMRSDRDAHAEKVTEYRVKRAACEKEKDALERERQRLLREAEESLENAREEENSIARFAAEEESAGNALAEMQGRMESEQDRAAACKKEQQELEEEKASVSERLSGLRKRREELLIASRDRAERIHKQELTLERSEMELSSQEEHIWTEYQLTYANALPYKKDISISKAGSEIARLKEEIRALGDVNVSSIEEYSFVLERHDSMTVQRDDLRMAKSDLESLIADLTAGMEKEFREKFELIKGHFKDTFVELFGGGYAELRLADTKDVLNCDIDIIAQPPGKKLQLLSLLSGGERALTAIALLFAMLRIKPPAFCVLDEIESSLDEANVARFADYLKAYCAQTQFIVITHRRGSMAAADSLYGVSMEEKGISKIVSAKLDTENE